ARLGVSSSCQSTVNSHRKALRRPPRTPLGPELHLGVVCPAPPRGSPGPRAKPVGLMEQPVEVRTEPLAEPVADPRTWTRFAACGGKTHLFYAPPAERPEARAVRELK